MFHRGRHIKQDDFGGNIPSAIPVIENPETGEIEPSTDVMEFSPDLSQETLNTADTVNQLNSELNRRTDAVAAPLEALWASQGQRITMGDVTQGGLSQGALNDIQDSYENYIESDLNPTWIALAALGAANVVPGIESRFGMMEGILPPVTLPGPSADAWIRSRSLEMAVDLTAAQRQAGQVIIQRGLKQGLNERVIARQLRPVIGLTSREAASVEKLRNTLVAAETPLARIETLTAQRAKKLLNVRAKRIARTEMTWSYSMGQLDAVKSYQAAGWIPKNVVVAKKWRKVLPVIECFCDALDGQIIGIDATFPGATDLVQSTLTPPAHPNCACTIDIVILTGGTL